MAKDKAKAAKADKSEKAAKADAPEFKYGVADLAKALNIKDASVRVQLRNKNVKKAGKSYGWNTKDELDTVVAKLSRGEGKAEKADAKADKGKAKSKGK